MAEPTDYITATRKNFVTNDNEERMIEKCIVEIQGAFLVKICNYAFNGNIGENALSVFPVSLAGAASKWFTKECIGSITTWDNMVEKFILKIHHLSDHNEEEETEKDDNPNETDNVPEIFKTEGNLFDFETPLNGSSRKHDLFSRSQVIASFSRMENFERGPYANMKTKWASNPYLDVNRIFERDYEASNVDCTQENQGHKGDLISEPSNCKVRRFEMMKYSFDDDEEYITIKESEYLNHSKDSLDAYRELYVSLMKDGS
ncbi:hypothetical protein Tco_0791525 [Tanacetum coccineum]